MKISKSTSFLIAGVCLAGACLLQGIGLARYVARLPHDWVGIGLYIAAVVGFAFAAVGFCLGWRGGKRTAGTTGRTGQLALFQSQRGKVISSRHRRGN